MSYDWGLGNPVVDGFTHSLSMLYLPTVFRASVLAQMELLRRAKGYRVREYCIPDSLNNPIAAFGQVEQQINMLPGSYIWALTFSALTDEDDHFSPNTTYPAKMYIQLTDACTETPFFSDYAFATHFEALPNNTVSWAQHNPHLLSQPRLIGIPGLVDVEIYNSNAVDVTCQLVVCVAEPSIPPPDMERIMREEGLVSL